MYCKHDYSGLIKSFHRCTEYSKVLLPAFGTVLLTNLNKKILSWSLISTCISRLCLNDFRQESVISCAKELQACYSAAGLTRIKSSKRKESGKTCWKKKCCREKENQVLNQTNQPTQKPHQQPPLAATYWNTPTHVPEAVWFAGC